MARWECVRWVNATRDPDPRTRRAKKHLEGFFSGPAATTLCRRGKRNDPTNWVAPEFLPIPFPLRSRAPVVPQSLLSPLGRSER